ncbi:helix-turn-helix domain-containing protein, partial [Desulforhopalus singaporensis]
MARPKGTGKYKPEYDQIAYVACVEGGFTVSKVAKLFGVDRATVYRWMDNHESFRDSIKSGRDKFDTMTAEDSLLKRIKGYRTKESTQELKIIIDPETGETEEKLVTTKTVNKAVASDVTATIFFLKNRAPERWRDAKHLEHTGKDGGPIKTDSSNT